MKHNFKNYLLPNSLDSVAVALFGRKENKPLKNNAFNLHGTFVSNTSHVEGVLIKIDDNCSLEEFENILKENEQDAIIYCKFISPHMVNIADQYNVKALCSMYGSNLSHPSILAREANITFLINIELPSDWQTGYKLVISPEGEICKR